METPKKPEVEKCVNCGAETPYLVTTPVDMRDYYVDGAGQLCMKCYFDLFEKRKK